MLTSEALGVRSPGGHPPTAVSFLWPLRFYTVPRGLLGVIPGVFRAWLCAPQRPPRGQPQSQGLQGEATITSRLPRHRSRAGLLLAPTSDAAVWRPDHRMAHCDWLSQAMAAENVTMRPELASTW